MKENQTTRIGCAFAFLLLAAASAAAQTPLGSEFTYQGQLKLAGQVLNDTADFEFTLWDADTAGNMIGSLWPVNNVTITGGLFTVELDFGVMAFNGENRWLEIDVRSPAGSGAFTTLSPRQPLTAIPYSLQTRGLFVDNAGNVGIGESNPIAQLHVKNAGIAVRVSGADNDGTTAALKIHTLGFAQDMLIDGNEIDQLQNGIISINGNTTGDVALAGGGGNVGIGTGTPATRLHVEGGVDVEPGSGGFLVLGPTTGLNLALDNNEIMARNNGGVSPLILNRNGGDTLINSLGVGNVGIRTASPSAALDVVGTTELNGDVDIDGRVGIGRRFNNVALNVKQRFNDNFIFNTQLSNGDNVLQVQSDREVVVFGDFFVTGEKNFILDHPLDPAAKSLTHNAVEGPDRITLYRGSIILGSAGRGRVELPDYFEALNRDFTYHLTCVGGYAPVYVSQRVENNTFQIAGGTPGLEVSWQVTGIRNDPYARENPYQVVRDKTGDELGRYWYPEGYGQPHEMSISMIPGKPADEDGIDE